MSKMPDEWYVDGGRILKSKFKTADRVPGSMVEELLAATQDGKELVALLLNQAFSVKEMSTLAYSSTKFLIEVIQKYQENKDDDTSRELAKLLLNLSDEAILKLASKDEITVAKTTAS